MASNGSFYSNGLPISTAETGLGNVPTGAPAANKASSSFYLSGSSYTEANPPVAAASATAAAASAAAAAASLAAFTTSLAPYALTTYVDAADALKAPLASPALTGVPTAPTAAALNSTAQVATTAYTDTAVAARDYRTRAMTGTAVGQMPATSISVTDTAQVSFSYTDPAGNYTPEGWANLSALTLNITGQASNATGGRTALLANAFLKAPSDPSNTSSDFYAGAVLTSNIYSDDNGTAGTPRGSAFGLATVTYLKSTVKHWADAFGAEFDVVCEAGSAVSAKIGVFASQWSTDAVQGSSVDIGYALAGGGPGWRNGFCAWNSGTGSPLSSDGSLLSTSGSVTMTNAIDVSSATVSGYYFKSGPFKVTAQGFATLSANASATLPAAFAGDSVLMRLAGADATRVRSVVDSFGTGVATAFSTVNLRRANGTGAAPSAIQSGDLLFGYVGAGYGTTAYQNAGGAGFTGWASQTFTDTVGGTELAVVTTPNGSVTNAEVLRFLQSGQVKFTNAANFSANGAVATSLGSVGPTGAHTTVQEWLTFQNASGVTRYIPCF